MTNPSHHNQPGDDFDGALDRGLVAAFGAAASQPVDEQGTNEQGISEQGTAPAAVAPPIVARYELLEEIGRGGMGAVYRARDRELQREVAVKLLHVGHDDRLHLVERFVEEAQITGQLQHPGIVPVYETGYLEGNRPFIAMKLVGGRTLVDLLNERADPERDRRRFLGIFLQVCQTVAFAHARHVVHRDLKPANIMVGTFGEVQVLDWGFAKVLGERDINEPALRTVRTDHTEKQSVIGSVMGTPAYMPREQARGQLDRIGPHSDVFALGAILCQILTGAPAFLDQDGDLMAQAAQGDMAATHRRLATCGGEPELVELATTCLRAEIEQRPATAGDLASKLEGYFEELEVRAERARVDAASARLRARATVGIAALTLLVLATATIGYQVWRTQANERAEQARGLASEALHEARAVVKRAEDHGSENLTLWAQAVDEANRAVLRAKAPEVSAGDRRAADTLLSAVMKAKGAAERTATIHARDAALRTSLTALKLPVEEDWINLDDKPDPGVSEARRLAHDYDLALTAWLGGTSPLQLTTAAAEDRIRSANVAAEIVEALDHWALACSVIAHHDEQAAAAEHGKHLLAIANAVDDDAWRTRLRTILINPFLMRDDLLQLAATADRQLPAASVRILGQTLWEAECEVEALRVFRNGCDQHPDDAQLWFSCGLALQRVEPRRWQDAAYCFQIVRALVPDLLEPQHRLGLAQEALGDHEGAAITFERLVRLQPKVAHWRQHLCQAFKAQNQLAAALEQVEAALATDPGQASLHSERGNILLLLNRQAEAEAAHKEAVALAPGNPQLRLGLALVLQKRGQLDRAIEQFRAVTATEMSATAHGQLAVALVENGDRREAKEQFERALAIDPKYISALASLGRLLAEGRQYAAARKKFEQTIAIDPNYIDGRYWYAMMARELGDNEAACEHLEHALRIDERVAKVHQVLATVQERQGKFDLAARSFARAIELDPDMVSTYVNLGNLKRRRGEPGSALELYDEAIARQPTLAMAHACKGLALLDLDQLREAVACMHHALHLSPSLTPVHTNLGRTYLLLNEHELAIKHYQLAVKATPRDPTAQFNLATVFAHDGFDTTAALHHANEAQRLLRAPDVKVPPISRKHVEQRLPDLLSSLRQAVLDRDRLLRMAREAPQAASVDDLKNAAMIAYRERLFGLSVSTYEILLAKYPQQLGEVYARTRYQAACSAVLAAASVDNPDDASTLRQQAMDWLRGELDHFQSPASAARADVCEVMRHWRKDRDLLSVRSSDALDKFSPAERAQWLAIWKDVAANIEAFK